MTNDITAASTLFNADFLEIELVDDTTMTEKLIALDSIGILVGKGVKNTFYPWSRVRSVAYKN